MNQKGFAHVVLVVLGVILVVTVGYFALPSIPSSQNRTPGWEKFSDPSLAFEYPSSISVKQEGENLTLSHSIDYKHSNPCDFKGDAPPLETLSDFDVSLKIFNQNLKETLEKNEGSDSVVMEFFENNSLNLSEGFIEKFDTDSLKGFQITSGVEGCGTYTYYFPVSSKKTLVVHRSFISEFRPINEDYQTYINLPGIIPPNQEKVFFEKILSSFKVK